MKGVILDFSVQHNAGVISGDDQNRYNFNGSDWRGQNSPQRGDKVDFGIGTEGQATDIKIASERILNLKNRLNKILAKNTGKNLKRIERDTERDNYLDANEAVGYGLVDKIIQNKRSN